MMLCRKTNSIGASGRTAGAFSIIAILTVGVVGIKSHIPF